MTLFYRSKKVTGIEELLGLNVRDDRIIINGKQVNEAKMQEAVSEIDWTKFTAYAVSWNALFSSAESADEEAKSAAILTQEQVELIKKVQAKEEVRK